jgi:putative AdoMet-dependent methyltransferase
VGISSPGASRMPQPDPFPPEEFDAWAGTYDQDVLSGSFPFIGYEQVLDAVVERTGAQAGHSVLDLGAGTGNLAVRFARQGCKLWLTDFSESMLNQARSRLPGARFFLADLRSPFPAGLNRRFDRIVSAYVFHHFELPEKVRIIAELVQERLKPGGLLVIADLSFSDQTALDAMRAATGDLWEEEPYWITGEALESIRSAGLYGDYQQVSPCAGIYRISKVDGK